MPPSLNTQIADALTARHLRVLRVEAQHQRKLWAILALLEADLLLTVKGRDPTEPGLLAWRRRRVAQLMEEEIVPLVESRYQQMAEETFALVLGLAQQEARAVPRLVNEVTGDTTLSESVLTETLRRRLMLGLFPSVVTTTDRSATGDEWWARLGASLLQRLGDQLSVSVSLEEPLTTMVDRVRGTAENAFTDGLMAKARQETARLLRTQVTHAVSTARTAVAEANSEAVVLQHNSTIDTKTSLICLGRDGLRFRAEEPHEPIGHSIPYLLGVPYHPGCRSSIDPVLANGGAVAGGGVEAFLERQSVPVQREMLGAGRWQLWKDGKLGMKDLLDAATGRPLTLAELGA